MLLNGNYIVLQETEQEMRRRVRAVGGPEGWHDSLVRGESGLCPFGHCGEALLLLRNMLWLLLYLVVLVCIYFLFVWQQVQRPAGNGVVWCGRWHGHDQCVSYFSCQKAV